MPNARLFALSVAITCAFCLGGYVGYTGEKEIFDEYIARQTAASLEQEKRFAEEREQATRILAEAVSERDAQISSITARNSDLSGQLRRMRDAVKNTGSVRPAKSGDTGKPAADADSGCRELLVRGAELLQQCSALLGKNAADHDALAKVTGAVSGTEK